MARILMITQVYYPDATAVSQVLSDLAEEMSQDDHPVDVISSRFAYENPNVSFPAHEIYRGIQISRIWQTGFSKRNRMGRILNFLTFNLHLSWHLGKLKKGRYDLIIGTTVPPFLSFIGLLAAKLKRAKYCFYAMDLQPELAIASGYLNKNGLIARISGKIADFIYRESDLIVALDRYMASHIVNRGARPERVKAIPVWPAMSSVYEGNRMDNPFRRMMGFDDKIIVMYSGNMAVVHPVDTLLESALALRDDGRFLFVFIGGGVRKKDVEAFKIKHGLMNIMLLPLQPREDIPISLGSADLQVVIHGNGCTGYAHPSKIYGAMFIGKPVLYIGPRPSHISDILDLCPGNITINHGDSKELMKRLREFASAGEIEWSRVGERNKEFAHRNFSRPVLMGRIIGEIESVIT